MPKLDQWLRALLWDCNLPFILTPQPNPPPKFEIHRLKARIPITNGTIKIIQGVREIFEVLDPKDPGDYESNMREPGGKIVFVGRGISEIGWKGFRDSFWEATQDGWLF